MIIFFYYYYLSFAGGDVYPTSSTAPDKPDRKCMHDQRVAHP